MAKKKRRPRNRPPASREPAQDVTTAEGPKTAGASATRRAHKEEARKAREAARKREVRVSAVRRVIVISGITLVAVGTLWFLQRAASPRPISAEAVAAAQAANCTGVVQPLSNAPGGQHLSSGQSYTYPDHPATSGPHDPSPLPTSPDVYTTPVPETQAVHFLEHSGVILYYRQTGKDALKQDVVDALGQVARDQHNTLLAPYTDLPDGTSLALTTWNHIQKCPGTITASQASTVANGFVNAFACTSVGPEPKASPDC